jgi:hypothetical protein
MPSNYKPKKNKRKQPSATPWMLGLFGILVFVLVAVILSTNARSANSAAGNLMGDAVPISSSAHVPSSTNPGPYASNPPAGGKHFDENWPAHFYEESELASLPTYPEGYLVHSLEHGYVIFWYNCNVASVTDCDALKQSIRNVMDETGGTKLIAFPWASMDVPLALTSWGRILNFDQPDEAEMARFVRTNRYQAPEPNAP